MRERFSTGSGRLEAFSDGVIAVIITIMVLDLRPPHGVDLASLHEIVPTLAAYVISFIFVGIYWNNHHHLFLAAGRIDGRVMWANLHFLFWLSLAPFVTAWVGQNPSAAVPTALYCLVLFCDGIVYVLLRRSLMAVMGQDAAFSKALQVDIKGRISVGCYIVAIGFAFVYPPISDALVFAVAMMWFIPDGRLEPVIIERAETTPQV